MSEQELHIHTHIGSDGIAHLDIPIGIVNRDIDVTISYSVADSTQDEKQLPPAEKAKAFREWAESHRRNLPSLSDEAISRESIYSNERL